MHKGSLASARATRHDAQILAHAAEKSIEHTVLNMAKRLIVKNVKRGLIQAIAHRFYRRHGLLTSSSRR